MVAFTVKLDDFVRRLNLLEYTLGINGQKPKVFVDIEDKITENNLRLEVAKQSLMNEVD